MFLELDPGHEYDANSDDDEFQNGDTIPVANTAPDTNVDQILSALDGDTRAYLRLLLVGRGQGLNGRGKDLGKLLGSLGPINRGLARINTEVAKRKENLATLIHNMNLLFGRVGEDGQGIAQLVSASNSALGAIASQSPDVQRTVSLLGPTLSTTRDALAQDRSARPGPGADAQQPAPVRSQAEARQRLARATWPRPPSTRSSSEIRPFVRAARQPVREPPAGGRELVHATPA